MASVPETIRRIREHTPLESTELDLGHGLGWQVPGRHDAEQMRAMWEGRKRG